MENLSQEHLFSMAFNHSIDKENQLISKYQEYIKDVKSKELRDIIIEFEKSSYGHINMLKNKMKKLNIKG